MTPLTTVDAALAFIDAHDGAPDELRLPIADSLIDELGVNMAIITDRILARGWMPDGFEQREGYRVCHYTESD